MTQENNLENMERGFEVGDRVIMTSTYDCAKMGDIATIRYIHSDMSSLPYGLEFDNYDIHKHDLQNIAECENGHGYWVPSGTFKLLHKTTCDICNTKKEFAYIFENKAYCTTCLRENNLVVCSNCHEVHKKSESIFENGSVYCKECYDNLNRCVVCGEVLFNDSELCDTCSASVCINDYSYKPSAEFYELDREKDTKNKWYIGFELETEYNEYFDRLKALALVKNNMGDMVYFKEDGSLEYGVEIVSHPATYNWYRENSYKIKTMLLDIYNMSGTSDNDTCGLHFHISRSAFGTDRDTQNKNIDKFVLFIEYFSEFTKDLSRRDSFNWCEYLKDNYNYDRMTNKSKKMFLNTEKIKKIKGRAGHYQNVNLCNSDTIELRIAKGTLDIDYFMGYIEFINSLINVVVNNKVKDISVASVVNYADNPHLKSMIDKLHIHYDNTCMRDYRITYLRYISEIKKARENILEDTIKSLNYYVVELEKENLTENEHKMRNRYMQYALYRLIRKIENNIDNYKNNIYELYSLANDMYYRIPNELNINNLTDTQSFICNEFNDLREKIYIIYKESKEV